MVLGRVIVTACLGVYHLMSRWEVISGLGYPSVASCNAMPSLS